VSDKETKLCASITKEGALMPNANATLRAGLGAVDQFSQSIRRLNLQMLETPAFNSLCDQLDGEPLIQISPVLLQAVARFPILLADLNWCHVAAWQQGLKTVQTSNVVEAGPDPVTFDVLATTWKHARQDGIFHLSFGVAVEVSMLLVNLDASRIPMLAKQIGPADLRWRNEPRFWSALLHAAATGEISSWRAICLHGVQLLGRDLKMPDVS
jgi:hypothetical protein